MDYATLQTLVADTLARTDLASNIPNFINGAILSLERGYFESPTGRILAHNWRHMKTQVIKSLVAGDYLIENPVLNYKNIDSAFLLDINNTKHPLAKVGYDVAMSLSSDLANDKSTPKYITESPIEDKLTVARGSVSDLKVATPIFNYKIGSAIYTSVASETSLASGIVPSGKWGGWLFSINPLGTITSTACTANTTGFNTEALALAALPSVPVNNVGVFYLSVLGKTGQAFTPGTDGLEGGTSGNVAAKTNYYIIDKAPITKLLIRPTCDQAYTLYLQGRQFSPVLDGIIYTTNTWTESYWDLVLYGACLEAAPFLISDTRIPVWQSCFYRKLFEIIMSERQEEVGSFSFNMLSVDPLED